MLLDDVHWLDESSAQALLFAFRRLVADPIAVLLAARDDEQSVLYDADLPTIRVGGLSNDEAAALLGGLAPALTGRLHVATAGNPLALLELADDAGELAFAPEGAPVLVSARISRAFLRRAQTLDPAARRALVLAATSDTGETVVLERAARSLEHRPRGARRRRECRADHAARGHRRVQARPRPLGDLRRRAGAGAPRRAPGAGGSAPRPRRRSARLAPRVGRDRPRRRRLGGARAGRRSRARPQRVRGGGSGVRTRRAARARPRAPRAPVPDRGRLRVARRTGRARRQAARHRARRARPTRR